MRRIGPFAVAFLAIMAVELLLIAFSGGSSFAVVHRARTLHTFSKQPRWNGAPNALLSNAPVTGQWEGPFDWPAVAVHTALLPSGEVLVLDRPIEDGDIASWLWNPVTGSFLPAPNNLSNVFCAGHAALADGRLLLVGGHSDDFFGIPDATLFDSRTQTWSRAGEMEFPRWYPTATTLPDGRILAVSGAQYGQDDNASIPEVYDPRTDSWTKLPDADRFLPLYPYMFVLPDSRVLQAGSDEAATDTWTLNVSTQSWTRLDSEILDGGSAAMYLPGKVIKSGSAGDVDAEIRPSLSTTYVLDATVSSPRWRQTAPMHFPRAYHNLTLLPDGSVLATGGERSTDGADEAQAVFHAEIWSSQTETWTSMEPMRVPRLYHSTALLLSDGRVLVAGGGRWTEGIDEFSAEIYSPPYLFQGPHPNITSAPTTVQYGSAFLLRTSVENEDIQAVTLVRLGAVTHAYNQEQRFLTLAFTNDNAIRVLAPADPNLAPPGYYLLFVINRKGVPSVGTFVNLQ